MKIISCIFTFLFFATATWAQSKLAISSETQALAEAVLAIPVSKRIDIPMKTHPPLPIAKFDAALDRLASTVDSKTVSKLAPYEGDSIIVKIILISIDRRNHPDLYREISQYYFTRPIITESNFGQFSPIGPISPRINPKHTTPDHRKAWEYYLLTCYREKLPAYATDRPPEALYKIADTRSIITLSHFYREQFTPDAFHAPRDPYPLVEDALSNMPSTVALEALLECFSISEKNDVFKQGDFYKSTWIVMSPISKKSPPNGSIAGKP